MKIAIPTESGNLCAHFGHCEKFAIYEIGNDKIIKEEFVSPPPHEPGSHSAFLRELGCTAIIAGGMGSRAQQLFVQNNIEVERSGFNFKDKIFGELSHNNYIEMIYFKFFKTVNS